MLQQLREELIVQISQDIIHRTSPDRGYEKTRYRLSLMLGFFSEFSFAPSVLPRITDAERLKNAQLTIGKNSAAPLTITGETSVEAMVRRERAKSARRVLRVAQGGQKA